MPPENPRTIWSARSRELEAVEECFGALGTLLRSEAEIGAVESKDFARGQRKIQIGALGYDADQALDGDLLFPDVVFADEGLAAGGTDARGKDADGGGLAGAIGSQQAENFSRGDVERDAIERDDLWLGLFSFALRRAKGEAARARGHGRSRVVGLSQVECADAGQHWNFLKECSPRDVLGARNLLLKQPIVVSTHAMISKYREECQFQVELEIAPS